MSAENARAIDAGISMSSLYSFFLVKPISINIPVAPPATLSDEMANTFLGRKYTTLVVNEDIVLYWTGNTQNAFGQWFSFEPPVSVLQTRIDKAIPPVCQMEKQQSWKWVML